MGTDDRLREPAIRLGRLIDSLKRLPSIRNIDNGFGEAVARGAPDAIAFAPKRNADVAEMLREAENAVGPAASRATPVLVGDEPLTVQRFRTMFGVPPDDERPSFLPTRPRDVGVQSNASEPVDAGGCLVPHEYLDGLEDYERKLAFLAHTSQMTIAATKPPALRARPIWDPVLQRQAFLVADEAWDAYLSYLHALEDLAAKIESAALGGVFCYAETEER